MMSADIFKAVDLPSIEVAKQQAKRLRAELERKSSPVSHSQSLELVASQYGFRDWNTMHAKIGNAPSTPWRIGDYVEGHFLSQPFAGEVIGLEKLASGMFRITVEFEEPVDVVTFDSFSNFRKRITSSITTSGVSREVTSNGEPQLKLKMYR